MGSAVSSLSSIGGSVGGAIGGLIGQSQGSGYASQASNEAGMANNIMQQMAAVPDIQKPLVLEQYRQAGLLTPAMEQQISLGVSQASQVKANPALQAAQNQALQSMAQRSQMGLTASDRAAFNQLQQQVGSQTQGRMQAIQQQQQAQTGGQGTQGATLAAKLAASQGGANTEALNADQMAAQASNNALQATAQYGSMSGQMNQQQFQQQEEAAKAADSFRQFDVQNQVAQQQRNTAAQNQAQQYNLNLSQNIGNANVSQANQEQYNQLQRQAQQWQMQDTQAVQQSQSAAGYGNTLAGMAAQKAQAGANLGAGLGGAASAAASSGGGSGGSGGGGGDSGGDSGGGDESAMYNGGRVKGYATGGQINQTAFSGLNPIQLAGMSTQQTAAPFAQYNMPQRGAMPPINFNPPQPETTKAKQTSNKPSKSTSKNASPNSDNVDSISSAHSQGPSDQDFQQAFKSGGTNQGPASNADYDAAEAAAGASQGDRSGSNAQSDASSAASQDSQNYNQAIDPSETNESISQGDTQYKARGGQMDYRSGGKVPGKSKVKGDSPKNDIVPARLSPGEIVLPRSIALRLKNAPDGDFNEHLNKIVGPFIRKSQAMADGGEVNPNAGSTLADTASNFFNSAKSGSQQATTAPSQDEKDDAIRKQNKANMGYSKGGEAEHDKKNLSQLDKAFHRFIKEESSEGYADGGQVDDSAGAAAVARRKAILKAAGVDPEQTDFEMETEANESEKRKNERNPYNQPDSSANGRNYDDGGEVDPDNNGIDANDSSTIKLASGSQIQNAAAGDAGASAAPPKRPNFSMQPPKASSSGGGGGGGDDEMAAMAFAAKGGEIKRGMADGGEAEAKDDSAWGRLMKNLHSEFNTPKPTPTPEPDDDHAKEYEKIRHQNLVNMGEASDTGYSKGGKVKNALAMLKSINGYADGGESTDDSQPASTDVPRPDTDDDEDDSAIVRANPDSDSSIDQVAQNEFQEDQPATQDDSEDLDRSKDPASMEMVKKEDEKKSPEEASKEEKDFEERFKKGEEQPDSDQSVASADDSQKPDLTQADIDALGKASPSDTTDEEQPLKSPEEKMSDLQKQLRRAQAQRYSILQGAQGAKYGALIAAGLAGHGAKPVGAEYFNADKLADLPVKDIQEQLSMEKDDPTSAVSKFYRQRLEQSLNMNIDPGVSASGMEKMFPQVTKIVGAEYQLNAKKQMADISQKNKMALLDHKNDWQQQQNDLNRSTQIQGHKMMADAMGQRATIPAVTAALKDVENDPVVKPLRIGQQALSLSKSMLENPDVPVTPALLNDASNGFTQALALRPGAVTQKRYDATKITTLKNKVAAFVAQATDHPDIDMRTYDPALYNTLHNYVNTLHDDYNVRLQGERNRLIKEKGAAYTAAGVPNVTAGVNAIGDTGAAGMTPQAVPGGQAPAGAPARTLVKKGYNKGTNQTQFIYSDGSKETKPGKL